LAAVLGLALAACGSGPPTGSPSPSLTPTAASQSASPTPSPSPSPSPETPDGPPSTTPTEDPDARGVRDAVTSYYAEFNRLSRDPAADLLDIFNAAVDPQSERAYAQLVGVRDAGQTQTGDIQAVVDAYILADAPNTFIADVCVDTTAADILDADGESVWEPYMLRRTWASIWVVRMGSAYAVSDIQAHLDQAC
jgi:hypothetical protein